MNAIRLARLAAKVGLSRASIYRRLNEEPDFPRPFRLGNCVVWDEADVDRYLESRKAASHAPAQGAKK